MRLVLATVVALVAWSVVPPQISATTRALLAWDGGGVVLLGFAALIITRSDAAETRRRAAAFDPGRRVVWLVDHNEYKRRQAPPGVKVSGRAFGRDRRLPITNKYWDE